MKERGIMLSCKKTINIAAPIAIASIGFKIALIDIPVDTIATDSLFLLNFVKHIIIPKNIPIGIV